jgi:putative transposase
MEDYKSLSHTRWQCKYHVVFIPKCRRKKLFGVLRKEIGPVFRRLAEQKGCRIEEGHVMTDHVHFLISIPPKLAVSSVIGYIKGKSAIHIARHFLRRERNYAGQRMWARGFFVDTVGRNTEVIRNYIRNQEKEDVRLDQLNLTLENQERNETQ